MLIKKEQLASEKLKCFEENFSESEIKFCRNISIEKYYSNLKSLYLLI